MLLPTLFILSLILPPVHLEDYRKLRPINDLSFRLHHVKISFLFRYRDDLRFTVQNEMFAQAIDGSISHVPVRSPMFFGRYALVQRMATDVQGKDFWHKQSLKQQYFSNMFILDYEDQFFPKSLPVIIDLKGTKILNQRGQVGLQERYYWDRQSQKKEFYVFTNMFPNHVPHAIPFVNDWRTNIELKVAMPAAFGYSVITPGLEKAGLYIYNQTCLSDISFVVIGSMQTTSSTTLKFSVKSGHKKKYPMAIKEFEATAKELYPSYQKFLSFNLPSVAKGVHLMTVPTLNVRPLVLASQMCLFDQDWIGTQTDNHGFYLAQCFLHQYFCATLLPYSPPIRFISDGLFAYYTILTLKDKQEADDRMLTIFNQVLVDEERRETATTLFKDYLEEYPMDQRRTNKGVYVMQMIRSHFSDEKEFDKIIYNFMQSFRTNSFSYNDFTFAFYNSFKQLRLSSYHDFLAFFNSWTRTTGYPLITVEVEMGKLKITSRLTNTKDPNAVMTYPIHVILMDKNGGIGKSLIWLATGKEVLIPFEEKAYPYYFLNPFRSTPARVLYPSETWESFLNGSELLPFKIKAVLLNDAFYFFAKGKLDYNIMFRFLKWLKNEKRVHMWISMEPVILAMHRRWLYTDLHSRLTLIIQESIQEFYFTRREHNSSLAVKFACWSKLPECLKDSENTLMEFISNPEVDVKMHLDATLCGGMRRIPSSIFQHFIELSKRVWEKRDILMVAMCCNEREHDIELFIRSIFTRHEFSISKNMKYLLLLNTFMSSNTGAEVVWRFIDHHHELLFRLFGRVRFIELSQFLSEYLKRKSQYRSLILIYGKFDLRHGNIFRKIIQNRLDVDRDLTDKFNYLTKVILEKSNL